MSRAGEERERLRLWDRASSRGESGQSGGVGRPGGPRVVPPGTGGGGGGGPPPSMDLPRRAVAAVAVGGTGRVVVSGGAGPRRPLRRGPGGRVDILLGRGGGGPWW